MWCCSSAWTPADHNSSAAQTLPQRAKKCFMGSRKCRGLRDDALRVAFQPADFRLNCAVRHQLQHTIPGRTIVDGEVGAAGQELSAGCGRGHEAHAVHEAVERLMHVS